MLALGERLRCVPRILAALNAKRGRPLDEHDLADVVQDTLLVVWRKLDLYDGRVGLEGYVFRICTYELMNGIRRRRRQLPALDLAECLEGDAAAADGWERWIEREAIDRAIDRVGGVEAETMRLKHWEGLTFEEMAVRMGTSTASAKDRYYRGLIRLTEIMQSAQAQEDVDA